MRRSTATTLAVLSLLCFLTLTSGPAPARIEPFPPAFKTEMIADQRHDALRPRRRQGPAVVLLHGYGETGDMWAPLAATLAGDHTVIVPDLRGMGLSARPAGGYDKKTQGQDIAGVLDALKIDKADLVTHDIGNMVGYAFAAQYPDRVTSFVLMDAPLPGVGPWDEIVRNPLLWHFSFRGPDAERLVAGRERIYLDRFWNEFSADPKSSTRRRASIMPRSMPARARCMPASSSSRPSIRTPIDNKAFVAAGKLTMPVLAIGGEKSFGPTMAVVMRAAATNVTEGIVPAFGPLGDGGKSGGDHQARHGFSRAIISALRSAAQSQKAPRRIGAAISHTHAFHRTVLAAVLMLIFPAG